MPARGSGPTGLAAVGSVAVRTFAAHQGHQMPGVTQPAHMSMDGHHVNAMAGDGSGGVHNHFADYDELPDGHFYDPDAEYEPDPEYAATLAPDAARQRRERIGPTGRPLPYFPIPGPLTSHGPATIVAMCNQKGGVGKTTSTIEAQVRHRGVDPESVRRHEGITHTGFE